LTFDSDISVPDFDLARYDVGHKFDIFLVGGVYSVLGAVGQEAIGRVKGKQMGTLYVVGIPEGNLADVTLRALRVLREVGLVIASDLARVQAFLAHYEIDAPLACWAGSESQPGGAQETANCKEVLEALHGGDVALVLGRSRAADSEMAAQVVRAAVEQGFAAVTVPGPSVMVTALVTSGLPADAYISLGFLPENAAERRQLLTAVATEQRTLVALLASSHLLDALRDVAEILGNRPLTLSPVSMESDEKRWQGTVSKALVRCETNSLRGEWALVIGGATGEAARWPEDRVRAELARLLADGLGRRAAARQVAAASGWRPREVYRLGAEDGFTFGAS
jgi:16S rRNA (cytidine1402-2'-O)-methyltransferase